MLGMFYARNCVGLLRLDSPRHSIVAGVPGKQSKILTLRWLCRIGNYSLQGWKLDHIHNRTVLCSPVLSASIFV